MRRTRALLSLLAAAAGAAAQSLLRAPQGLLVESLAAAQGVDAPAPRFSWSLAPGGSGPAAPRSLAQAAYELSLWLSSPDAARPPLWTSGRVASGATSLVAPPGMPALPPSARIWWRVRAYDAAGGDASDWSAPASFTTGAARWDGASEWVCGAAGAENVFRAPFVLPVAPAEVAVVLAHVAGLGVHAVTFNGAPAGGDALRKLDGGWTSYAHRVLYTSHDLTAALLPGENVLGVALGNSWFNDAGWYKRPPYGWPGAANGGGFSYDAPPLLRVQLVLTLTNGSQVPLVSSFGNGSGGAVFAGARGPVLFDSLYDGETYDGARAAALAGWDSPGFAPAPADWTPVVAAMNSSVNPVLGARLQAQPFEPTVRLTSAPPLTTYSPLPGVAIYDFGENGIGNVRWTFRGLPAGTNVTMRYAEVLLHPPYGPANGSLYFDNLRNAHATDYYFADGSEGVEVYEPSFTWHGFRYAQVSADTGGAFTPPALDDVALVRQANGVVPGASTAFAAPLLGLIESMAVNTIFANLQGGPGSCGQRDERQFFTGDTQVSVLTSMQHFRLRALFASWILDGVDQQNDDGSIGYYLPTPIADHRDGSPQWSTGFITATWQLMRLEGDVDGCRAVYGAVQRYISFNEAQYGAAIKQCGNLTCYWPAWPAEWQQNGPDPDPSCMNSFAYVHDLQMAGDIADGLGEAADAAAFRARAAARTAEFHAAFFRAATSTYGLGTQSELSIALWLRAPPTPAIAAAVFAQLLAVTAAGGGKQLAGIVGARYLYDVLGDFGRPDVGVRILLDDTFPSFGFMVQGAGNPEPTSTLWELWAAYNGDPIMSSRNHLMFVSYSTFLLRVAVGVEPLGLGFADGALVWPLGLGLLNGTQPLLPFASGSMTTPRGEVRVAWSTEAPAPPAASPTCGKVEEADEPAMAFVNISCAAPFVVSNITFASFGRPTGDCGGAPFEINPSCHANNSRAVVEAACLGKQACGVAVDFHIFDTDCGDKKYLAVNASCSGGPPPPPAQPSFLGSLSVDVPVNLPATVRFQSFNLSAPDLLLITEGAGGASAPAVWRGGAFVPGVAGIVNAVVTPAAGPAGAFFIDVSVLSGAYSFTAWSSAGRR